MPDHVEMIDRVLTLINAGDGEAALALVDQVVTEAPDNCQAQFLRGEALRLQGKLVEAEETFRQALALGGGNAEVLFRLGLVHNAMSHFSDAHDSFVAAAQVNPDHHASWFYAGVLAMQLGKVADAVAAFRVAAELDPSSVQTLVNLATCLKEAGNAGESAHFLRQAIEAAPYREDLAVTLFHGLIEMGDLPGAEHLARHMGRHHPQSSWWNGGALGWILRNLRREIEAAAAYVYAYTLEPESSEFLAQAAQAYRQGGRPEVAKRLALRALRLDPRSANGRVAIAGVLSDEGAFDEALARLAPEADAPKPAVRSIVIAVLDYSPGAPYNIRTLLADLTDYDGEVICIFNSEQVFLDLKDHPRIDKYSYNKHNVGVSRAWNMGINQAEGETIHILNADMRISVDMLYRLERWVHSLPEALCVGVSAHWYDATSLDEIGRLQPGQVSEATQTDSVSGQLFTFHAQRLNEAGISFDPRLAPYFGEELDITIKAKQAGLKMYAVPETDFEHRGGISQRDRPITFFGRPVHRLACIVRNQVFLRKKARLIKDRW